MPAGDTLRSLHIDIEVDAEDAVAGVKSASEAVDELSSDLRGLLDDAAQATVALEVVGEKAESAGNEMAIAALKGQALQASLTSLSSSDISLPDIGDFDELGKLKVGGVASSSTSPDLGELTDIEEKFKSIRSDIGISGEFDRESAYSDIKDLTEKLSKEGHHDAATRASSAGDYIARGEQFIAEDQAQRNVKKVGDRLEEKDLVRSGLREEKSSTSDVGRSSDIGDVIERNIAEGIQSVDFESIFEDAGATETEQSTESSDTDISGGDRTSHEYAEGLNAAKSVAAMRAEQSALEEVEDEARSTSTALTITQQRMDELGDEATTATTKIGALSSALTGLGASSTYLSVGPLVFSLTNAVAVIGTLLPLVLSLTAALGGLATGLLAVAGVAGGAFAGGMLALGEQLAATSSEASTAMEGVGLVMEDFAETASVAMEPLKQPMFADMALGVLRGALVLLRRFSEFAARTYKELQPVIDAISGAWWDQTPEFFDALHNAAVTLAPEIQSLMVWLAGAIPDAINYLTQLANELWDEVTALGGAILNVVGALAEFGSTMSELLVPPIALVLNLVGDVIGAFNQLPDVLQESIVALFLLRQALGAVGGGIGLLEVATRGLGAAYTFLQAPISTAVATVQMFSASAAGATTLTGALSSALYGAAAAAWSFITTPLGVAVVAIAGTLAALMTNAYGVSDAFTEFANSLGWVGDIINTIIPAGESLVSILGSIGEIALAPIAIPLRALLEVLTALSNTVDAGLGAGVWSIVTPLRVLGDAASTVVEAGQGVLDWYNSLSAVGKGGALLGLATVFGTWGAAAWAVYEGTQALANVLGSLTTDVGNTSTAIGSLVTLLSNAASTAIAPLQVAFRDFVGLMDAVHGAFEWAASGYKSFTQSLQNDEVDKAIGVIAPIIDGVVGALSGLIDAGGKLAELGLVGIFWLWGINLAMVASNAAASAAANLVLAASNSTLAATVYNVITGQYLKSAAMSAGRAASMAASAANYVLIGSNYSLLAAISSTTTAQYASVAATYVANAAKSAAVGIIATLQGAYWTLTSAQYSSTAATYAKAAAMWTANTAGKAYAATTYALSTAYGVLTGAITSSTAAAYARATATKVVSGVMYAATAARYALSTAYGVLTGAITAATIAEYAFLAPILLIIAAVGALIGLFVAYQKNLFGVKDIVDGVAGALLDLAGAIVDSLLNPLETLNEFLEWLADLEAIEVAVKLVQEGWDWITPDTGKEQLRENLELADQKQNFTVEQKQKINQVVENDRDTPGIRPRFAMGSQDKSNEGKKTGQTYAAGVQSVPIGKKVGNWLGGIGDYMPSSDAKKGPLSNLTSWGQSLGQTLISGLQKTPLGRLAGKALSGLKSALDGAKGWASGLFSSTNLPGVDRLVSAGERVRNALSSGAEGAAKWLRNINLPSIQMPDLGGIAPNLLGKPNPAPSTPTQNKRVDNRTFRDDRTQVQSKQDLSVEVNESDNPQQVRKEVENVSSQKAVEDIAGALKRDNNSTSDSN